MTVASTPSWSSERHGLAGNFGQGIIHAYLVIWDFLLFQEMSCWWKRLTKKKNSGQGGFDNCVFFFFFSQKYYCWSWLRILSKVHIGDWFVTVDLRDAYIQIIACRRHFVRFTFGVKTNQFQFFFFPPPLSLNGVSLRQNAWICGFYGFLSQRVNRKKLTHPLSVDVFSQLDLHLMEMKACLSTVHVCSIQNYIYVSSCRLSIGFET